jgi:hypothetical protein
LNAYGESEYKNDPEHAAAAIRKHCTKWNTHLHVVYKNPQRQWLAAAQQELDQRLQERAVLDRRIAELQQTIEQLTIITGQADERVNMSLPQLCLKILSIHLGIPQSIPQIKQGLEAIGVVVPGHNPLAVLHTNMGRLVERGLATARPAKRGGPLIYQITDVGREALQRS